MIEKTLESKWRPKLFCRCDCRQLVRSETVKYVYLDKLGCRRAIGYKIVPKIRGNAAPIGISAISLDNKQGPKAYDPFLFSLSTIERSFGNTPTVFVSAAIAVFIAATFNKRQNPKAILVRILYQMNTCYQQVRFSSTTKQKNCWKKFDHT